MTGTGVHPFDRFLASLREHGGRVPTVERESVVATCPAHDDQRPSLLITRQTDRVLLYCRAGCETRAVVEAVGLGMRDLYARPPEGKRPGSQIVADYYYLSTTGVPLRKRRSNPKRFRWQRSNDE